MHGQIYTDGLKNRPGAFTRCPASDQEREIVNMEIKHQCSECGSDIQEAVHYEEGKAIISVVPCPACQNAQYLKGATAGLIDILNDMHTDEIIATLDECISADLAEQIHDATEWGAIRMREGRREGR